MADIQAPTAEIRRGIKKDRRRKKPQDENIMVIINGSVLTALFLTGSSPTYHFASSVLHMISHSYIPPSLVFPKCSSRLCSPSSTLYHITYCTLLLSALSSSSFPRTATFTVITLNSSSPSTHPAFYSSITHLHNALQ